MGSEQFKAVTSALGKPYFSTDSVAIYNGNCLELLKKIPKGSIDLTFTSPPYNIGKEYEDILSVKEYVKWCEQWLGPIETITKNNGSFVLNVGYLAYGNKAKCLPITYLLWDKINMYLQQEIIWNYGAGVSAKKFLAPRNEKLLWYIKDPKNYCFNLDEIRDPDVAYPNQKKNGKLRCNPLGKNPSDVWRIAKVTSGAGRASKERTPHPAQFPMELCSRVIKAFSDIGGLVVDPFLGSGSTMATCIQENRYCIGFEIREDYCELAANRISGLQ
ncbi:site-specific DNA-methyltransferase [Acinetobacter baumannii]|nr:site-specific DNA-methyltransferase [Acinetobacter baumannii]HAV5945238.1 site-specific DNA-methyltransferase [Acinetobacter baumannii]